MSTNILIKQKTNLITKMSKYFTRRRRSLSIVFLSTTIIIYSKDILQTDPENYAKSNSNLLKNTFRKKV